MSDSPAHDLERELLRAYIDSANDGIFVVCDEMKFHVANPLLVQWLGISEAELVAHGRRIPITDLFGVAETAARFREQFHEVLRGRPVRFEATFSPAKGQLRWVEISMNRVRLKTGELVIGILRDITERKQLYTALQHSASHDDLTGLLNRREFQQRLHTLVESAHNDGGQHALIYVDLDQFKVVNDTCGHRAGDELLRQLGLRLRTLVQSPDVIARLGGDEFGLLLHDQPIERAMALAKDLCANLTEYRFAWEGRSFEVTASVGVRAITETTESAEEALSAADAACYVAKDQGRNRVQLYFGGTACTGKRQEMEWVGRIQKALDEDRLQMWQQRILNLSADEPRHADTELSGEFEALLRLIGEDGRVIAPGQFFPAAERYGLMPAIDRWVISCLLLGNPDKGLDAALANRNFVRCAINLSGASLNDDSFLGFLEDVLRRTPIAGTALCFEITETVAVASLGRAREVMQALKRFGCRFALDDFGSGMSSFGYLKNLPVDYLKIDGSLVRSIANDAADFAMVDAINRVGQVLGLQTIAEFVEDEATLRLLRTMGVNHAQGYAIHRPEPL
jgi:diguanylate cyclase (GGDEF)-like protein/PAS domain S-box-containing protein